MKLILEAHSVRKWHRYRLARFGIIVSLVLILSSAFLSPRLFSARAVVPTPPLISLQESTTPQVASSQLVRHYTSAVPMSIGVMLIPNQQSKMDDLLKQLYDPASTLYHHWLRKGAFDATFGATPAQQSAVKDYLVQAGLRLGTSPGSLFVVAAGTSAQLEQAFRTTINDYRRTDGSMFFANSTPIQIPQTWQGIVEGVFGLSDAVRSVPLLASQQAQQGHHTRAVYGGGPAGGLTPTQIAGIYDASPIYTILGHGVTLGLLEFSGYTPGDAIGYESQFGLTTVPQQYIMVNGGPADHAHASEVALDVEMMAALASSVDRIQLYEAPNSDLGQIWADYQIAQDDTANAISTSWGACEKEYPQQDILSEAQSFKFMALQGQSMFASTGDNGAYDCLSSSIINGTLQVSEVASQPYVTAVGGTSLASADPGSNPNPTYPTGKEKAWNDNCTFITCYSPLGSGGGGGNSKFWQRPTYQVGPGVDETKSKSGSWCNQAAGVPCREIPDVSLNADPASGYAIYCTDPGDSDCTPSGWLVFGGTSAAAPLWAAIAALTDSYLFAHGRSAMGFANPYLYQLNTTTGNSNVFHDIGPKKGNNGYYPTGAAYDMATGMGSIDIYRFVLQTIFPPFKQSVFVGAANHWVYALSASSGTPLWHYVTGSTPSTPVVANGTVYVSSDELYALNASDGSLLWRYAFGSVNNNCTPTIANGVVYAGSSDGYLYALNASTGALLWRYQTGGSYVYPPTVVGGVVYISSSAYQSNGNIFALNTSDGTLLWQQSESPYLSSQPVVSNGVIYFTFGQFIEAIKASDGSYLWSQQEGSNDTLETPVVTNGTAYIPFNGDYGLPGGILALNADNGVTLWSYFDTHSSYGYTPLVLNGVVYTDFYDGVYSLNAADGTLLWSSTIDPSVAILSDAPIINNGILYCGSGDGNIRTFNASTGSPIAQYLVSASVNGYLTDLAIAP